MIKVIGFYSHIPFSKDNNTIFTPSFIGKYLHKLSQNSSLVVFGHLNNHDIMIYDYNLSSSNIKFINLGTKRHSLIRFCLGFIFLIKHYKEFSFIDHMIVRSPTPLSFWFKLLVKKNKLNFLLVADEKEGAKNKQIFSYRDFFIKYFNFLSDKILWYSLRRGAVFVNSKALLLKYKKFNPNLVSTSNLETSDFSHDLRYEFNSPPKLLYVGRIDLTKGILETINAIFTLKKMDILCHYNIVGWDENGDKNIKILKNKVKELNLDKLVNFCGKKSQGDILNSFYNNSDIFICASYHESMPRTIYESMANSTAVIATKVGSIPLELEHNVNAILINSKVTIDIVESVQILINNFELRKKIIKNSYNLAKSKTINHSIDGLIKYLN